MHRLASTNSVSGLYFTPTRLVGWNSEPGDSFGTSLSHDNDVLVVGAPFEDSLGSGVNPGGGSDNSKPSSGAVYIFERTNDTWQQPFWIKASNSDPGDEFGAAVAIHGDTIVVGAPGESGGIGGVNVAEGDNSRPGSGAVYVFVRSGSNWQQQAYIKTDSPVSNQRFGSEVALHGDILAVTIANVGTWLYTFARSGSTWTQIDVFGVGSTCRSVAVSSDSGVLVGAHSDSSSSPGVVKARYEQSSSVQILAPNHRAGNWFGASVSMQESVLVAGATGEPSGAKGVNGDQEDTSAPGAGAAYVFPQDENGVNWNFEAYIKASNTSTGNQFGASLSLHGTTLLIGAIAERSPSMGINGSQSQSSQETGAVYVFSKLPQGWRQVAYLKAPRPTTQFGFSIDSSDEFAFVGTPDGTGAVYVYSLTGHAFHALNS